MTPRRVIVVGAGGAGVPFAVRLAAASAAEVLLLEAGPARAPLELEGALQDGSTLLAATPDGPLTWTYEAHIAAGHSFRVARGRVLGGSTAINGGYFLRPHPDDFATWAEAGGEAWSAERALPALRRLEGDLDFGETTVHGGRGPMPVARPRPGAATRAFLAAAAALGHRWEADKNAGGPAGAGPLPLTVVDGSRWSTARAFLANPVDGLEVRAGALVRRVLIERGRAVGVEVETRDGVVEERADEVVLAAGAVETPRLLHRSGVDRPGIGAGLSDHPAVSIDWVPRPGGLEEGAAPWTAALGFSPPGGAVRGELEILFAIVPNARILTGSGGGPVGLRVALQAPAARGRVALAEPVIEYRHLSAETDRARLRFGVREALRLLGSRELAPLVESVHAPAAAILEDDRAADAWIAANLGTSIHASSTARMGPASDPLAVVDARGRVHGVEALRVIDTSVLPVVPSRGTAATAIFLGERFAELWLEEG